MRPELRFIAALGLMIAVLIGTNLLFPPVPPPPPTVVDFPIDSVGAAPAPGDSGGNPATPTLPDVGAARGDSAGVSQAGAQLPAQPVPGPDADRQQPDPEPPAPTAPDQVRGPLPQARDIVVESELYRLVFSTAGARITSAELLGFRSFSRDGPVQLVPDEGLPMLGTRLVLQTDTLDLRGVVFEASHPDGLVLTEGGGPQTLGFTYRHPTAPFSMTLEYEFDPDAYLMSVRGVVTGVDRALLVTDLGSGIAFNEARPQEDERVLAYVTNHEQSGIRSEPLRRADEASVDDGPFRWAAFKSKYFVVALVAGTSEQESANLGGVIVEPSPHEFQAAVSVTESFGADGRFGYRVFLGPQELATLSALGEGLEDVNPYGWRFFRPIIRPFTGIITRVLLFLHESIGWGYGWVLILFGVSMRVVLWPLNQKAMRAQLRNMAVQPQLKEIQEKYKNNPEKLQKEMMRLYKEEGFNPLAGCLPMLIPWPVLIALFFVFQNTIELRGVPFLWLPDLSAPDPLYVLPVFLGLSMFLLQWIGMRSLPETNAQLKMMMWVLPVVMTVAFANFASGLNLYYATANIAMLPQQYWIAKERKKVRVKQSAGASGSDDKRSAKAASTR